MRELLRSTEGEIGQSEFRKGAGFLLVLTLVAGALFFGGRQLSITMEWMTVAVAPFFGLVVLFATCSLVYFWYCVFIKRLRRLGRGPFLLTAWLLAMFFSAAAMLVDYQVQTLDLAQSGPLVYAGFVALALAVLALFLFVLLLLRGWTDPA